MDEVFREAGAFGDHAIAKNAAAIVLVDDVFCEVAALGDQIIVTNEAASVPSHPSYVDMDLEYLDRVG